MSRLETSGPLLLRQLESGGWTVHEPWWVEADECDVNWQLADETAFETARRLVILPGFRFDGGSFIAIDSRNALQGFLAHDARYRASRQGLFGQKWGRERIKSDRLMYRLHRACGVSWVRAQYLWLGVRVGASDAARPQPDVEKRVVVAS